MNANMYSVPLTEKEIAKLSKEKNASFGCLGISLIILLPIMAFFIFLIVELATGNVGSSLRILIFVAPISFFIIYGFIKSLQSGRKYYLDLKEGRKQIITAPVEGKRVKFERNKEKGNSFRIFYLRAGGFTVRVSKTLYDEIKEGEIIKFEIAPHSETIFSEPKRNY
jgi:hypothetical protein